MIPLPTQPFLPKKIPLDGGGLDFLGLRWVNLKLLADVLLPGINNATQDCGTYCLATWMAWRFRRLCNNDREYSVSNFRRFREAVEVAIAHGIRPESKASQELGQPHRMIGIRQKLQLPGELSFAAANRRNSTSLFSAPLYGPSLKFLGLLTDAASIDGTRLDIPYAIDDPTVNLLAETVDRSLSSHSAYSKLCRLGEVSLTEAEVDGLAIAGLHPARYRNMGKATKRKFLELLVPQNPPNARTETARLLVATVNRVPGKNLNEIRAMWHSGLIADGRSFRLTNADEEAQRVRWAVFQSRQYQRYIVELFLLLFEVGLRDGIRSIDDLTTRFHSESGFGRSTLRNVFLTESGPVSSSTDWDRVAEQWSRKVGPDNPRYVGNEGWPLPEDSLVCALAFRLLARWWIPTCTWLSNPSVRDWLDLGGEDRVGMRWFHHWVRDHLDLPVKSVLRDIFEKLIFAQHVRIALSRFDGQNQRLRFALGDRGIVPTSSMQDKLTKGIPGWTADRLVAFANLLDDLGVIEFDDEGGLHPGEMATEL